MNSESIFSRISKLPWNLKFRGELKWLLRILAGGIIGIFIIGRVTDWWRGPISYKICVIGNFSGHLNDPIEIYRGFCKEIVATPSPLKIDKVNIEIKRIDDRGDPDNAKLISAKLAKANDTLMIIGHMSSTQTKMALSNYLEKNPPIPVILTKETNPFLIPESPGTKYYPLFLLSPTDEKQARKAATFAIERGGTTFWVIEDTSNAVYSHYLACEFIAEVQQKMGSVVLWTLNNWAPSSAILEELKIDCVFFAGGWPQALILIRQINILTSENKPMIILSDGCANNCLLDQGKNDVNGVYLTHPLSAEQFSGKYTIYGECACKIAKELINEANNNFTKVIKSQRRVSYFFKWLLNMHRISDARYVLNEVMEDAVTEPSTKFYCLLEEDGFIFERRGVRKGATFSVWHIEGGAFCDSCVSNE